MLSKLYKNEAKIMQKINLGPKRATCAPILYLPYKVDIGAPKTSPKVIQKCIKELIQNLVEKYIKKSPKIASKINPLGAYCSLFFRFFLPLKLQVEATGSPEASQAPSRAQN